MSYLEPGKFGIWGFPRGPQWLEGACSERWDWHLQTPASLPPTSLGDGCSLPQDKHRANTSLCLSPIPSQESRVLAHLELSINQAPGSSSEAEQMFRGEKEKTAQQLREDGSF